MCIQIYLFVLCGYVGETTRLLATQLRKHLTTKIKLIFFSE